MQPGQANDIRIDAIARSVAHQTARAAAPAPASRPRLHTFFCHFVCAQDISPLPGT